MAAYFFDIDGTIVNYHTSEWLEGAKEHILKLYKEGHGIYFITMRNANDTCTKWSIENTKYTILKDLDELGIGYTIIFNVQSPRIVVDDSPIFLQQRNTNQPYK